MVSGTRTSLLRLLSPLLEVPSTAKRDARTRAFACTRSPLHTRQREHPFLLFRTKWQASETSVNKSKIGRVPLTGTGGGAEKKKRNKLVNAKAMNNKEVLTAKRNFQIGFWEIGSRNNIYIRIYFPRTGALVELQFILHFRLSPSDPSLS